MHNRFYSGFSLVELMLAMVLGLMLTLMVGELYLSVKHTFIERTELSQLQDAARLAAYFLRDNIRLAGYSGCVGGRLSPSIVGYDADNMPEYLRKKHPYGDVVVITAAIKNGTKLIRDVVAGTKSVSVEINPASKTQRQLLIASCHHYDLLQATNYQGRTVLFANPLKHSYKKTDTEVARVEEMAFFIAKTSRREHGEPLYALYRMINRGRKEELEPNISNMQLMYAVKDRDGGQLKYLSATQIANWSRVCGVKIVLTLQVKNMVKQLPLYISLRERYV